MDNDMREAVASASTVLGSLYMQDPRTEEGARVAEGLAAAKVEGEWPFGGEDELAKAAASIRKGVSEGLESVGAEYRRQFVGPEHFEAPAWGSVYLDPDEIVFGNSNLELCQWMRKNGIESNGGESREPADHIGKMLVLLGWLAENKPCLVDEYLAERLMPWAPRYLDLLGESARQPFYEGLAALTRLTLDGIVEELGVSVAQKRLYH